MKHLKHYGKEDPMWEDFLAQEERHHEEELKAAKEALKSLKAMTTDVMYKPEDIKKANRSSMSKGFVVLKDGIPTSIVVKYIVANIDKYKGKQILDFGAGKYTVQAKYLRNLGLDVIAYDFGKNVTDLHDVSALERTYDVVYLSNVLNIQCSSQMLEGTLHDVKRGD